ncbi:FecCD family ABC transporter permease [Limnobacter sp.]|uniref:FecCD family ABC transporter permease n=1 Tax=Limnobacter sp. TaxID=2003368 RepID=UPI003513989C
MIRHPLILLVALSVALLVLALCVGSYPVGAPQAIQALVGIGDPTTVQVVQELRLPRTLGAWLVGAALACAGCAYQLLFKNPLVSPDILGVSAGASLGAVLALFMAWPMFAVQGSAFAGGLIAVALVMLIARWVQHADQQLTLVLIGVVLAALAGALTSMLKILADPYEQLPAITFWLLGSVSGVGLQHLAQALPFVATGFAVLFILRWRITALSVSQDESRAMGMPTQALSMWVILAATVMTSAVVSLAGTIGWVGLLVPHIARQLFGASFSRSLPACALLGGAFLMLVDTLARSLGQLDVPLGIITAMVGAPCFVWILAKRRTSQWGDNP